MSAIEERNRRLVKLLPAIQSQSQHWACRYPQANVDPADCVQEACMSFLKRAETAPDFLNQSDEEITRHCVLDAWNSLRRQQRFSDFHQVPLEPVDDDGEVYEPTFANDESIRPVEDAVCTGELTEEVERVIAGLKPTYQTVCRVLAGGGTRVLAMRSIGSSKQAFTWYRQKLQRSFAAIALL